MSRSQEEFDYFDSLFSRAVEGNIFVFGAVSAGMVLDGHGSGV